MEKREIFLQFHKLNTNKLVYNKRLYAPKLTQLSMQKEGKIRKIQRDFNGGSSTARSSLVIIGTGVQSRNLLISRGIILCIERICFRSKPVFTF